MMATLQVLPSLPSSVPLPPKDKLSNIKTANYSKIPLWVSLKSSTLPHQTRDAELLNIHLVSLSKQGKLKEAHECLLKMDGSNIPVTPQSYQYLLETCANLRSLHYGSLIHGRLGKQLPVFLANYVIQMYCDCGSLQNARTLFDEMSEKTFGSWLTIISAYSDEGSTESAFDLYLEMLNSNIKPTSSIYTRLLKLLFNSSYLLLAKQMHCQVFKAGIANDVVMGTVICNMYVKCGCWMSAKLGFDLMEEKNSVTWTTMMVGLTQAGRHEDTLTYLRRMMDTDVDLDEFVFSISLKACAGLNDLKIGEQVHSVIVKLGLESEVSVGTPLLNFYAKCGKINSACQAFKQIREPNDVSWSAILCGYSQAGEFCKCIDIFKFLRNKDEVLNETMYTCIFQVCSALADFNLGAQAHGDAIKRGLVSYLNGESSLITMYAKCGQLDLAHKVFEMIDKPDTVAWTALIAGCAYHGNSFDALWLFRRMHAFGVRANSVTFVAVFTACSHTGLVEEAKHYLEVMSSEYGVEPTIDHFDCMIDVYSRAGLLNEALELIKTMPLEPDAMSWKSFLGGCAVHRNFQLGKMAAGQLLQLDPKDTAAYILMFNLHASSGRWDEAARIRSIMVERGFRKEIGCSWITIKGRVHRFIVGDLHHPQTKEIYSKLHELKFCDSSNENVLLTEDDVSTVKVRKEQVLVHSERLAVAFGLISLSSCAPVMVFKNLRACKNCHDFMKHASLVTGRTIVVRDSNRFHHFKSGECSCGDYW